MSRPNDYLLVLPEDWLRIDLMPGGREPAIARLVDRQFRGIDNAPHLKRQARDSLLRTAQNAYGNGGIEMYVSLQTAAGFPLSASLVVTLVPPHQNEAVSVSLKRLARSLSENGAAVTITNFASGPAVRVQRRTQPSSESNSGYRSRVTSLDIHLPVPDSGAYLILSFSTPLAPLADAMVGLFDTIAGTLRWIP
jgi:hypothetical protein